MLECRECHQEFSVHPNDQKILDYFDAPAPTLCGAHSLQQRLAWRNERHLYKRTCELCNKEMLAMQSPRSYAHVYCRDCWYSDKWDPVSYGRDYDPSRPFFDQWYDLLKITPQFNVWHHAENSNCEYTNYTASDKNCYLSFSILRCEGLLYCKTCDDLRDSTDCLSSNQSELLYDCVTTQESYQSAFLTRSIKCVDCYLGRDLSDCQNCFGCVNLKHKQWYWYNEPLNEQEYKQRLDDALKNRQSFEREKEKFKLFSHKFPVECATIVNSEDASGDQIFNAQSVRASFIINNCENLGECYRLVDQRNDSYRNSYGGIGGVYIYESSTTPRSSYCMSCFTIGESNSLFYSANMFSCDDCFGCASLRKKKYYILNKQYTKDEYESLKADIISDMKARGEWGEPLPARFAPGGYNDSVAHEFFPLTRDETLARGLPWEDDQGGTIGKETLQPEAVPDDIRTTEESIVQEILQCRKCAMNYRIIKKELLHLKKLGLPAPLYCPNCRFQERLSRYIIPVLYHRTCMCDETHTFHAGSQCSAQFETTYRPDAKTIVYCNPCYRECLQ